MKVCGQRQAKIEAAKRQGDALVSLSQFSQSLTDFLVERQKEKNEEDELAGLELAYTEGLDPLTVQKFDEDEAEVKGLTERSVEPQVLARPKEMLSLVKGSVNCQDTKHLVMQRE